MTAFPPDLIYRVHTALARTGYCFLGRDEIQRLLAKVPADRSARYKALQQFADHCGAEVETNEHLKSARFTPLLEKAESAPSLQQQSPPQKLSDLLFPSALAGGWPETGLETAK